MDSAFHMLHPRYCGPVNPVAPMAARLWEIYTFYLKIPQNCTLSGALKEVCANIADLIQSD